MLVTEVVRVHPNCLVVYNEYYSNNGDILPKGNKMIHSLKKNYSNKLSLQSKKKLSKAITYMAHITPDKIAYNQKFNSRFKFRLTFITLTLSSRQQHDDTTIKEKLLHPFLDYFIKTYRVNNYVWKAERQKNMNLHFHIIFDTYINYAIIRDRWNHYQDRLNYISNYWHNNNTGKSIPKSKQEYYAVNSTDVHSTRKVKDLARYMCKYMVKDQSSIKLREKRNSWHHKNTNDLDRNKYSAHAKQFLRNLTGIGRTWGCSHSLTDIKGAYDTLNISLIKAIESLENNKDCYVYKGDYFKYISFKYEQLAILKLFELKNMIDEYCLLKFG